MNPAWQCASIQAAVTAAGTNFPGDQTINIDTSPYSEQVTVSTTPDAASRLIGELAVSPNPLQRRRAVLAAGALDLKDDAQALELVRKAASELFTAAIELGGTLSGEHGIGLLKQPYMARKLSPQLLGLMQQIKATFDPNNILNPGKMIYP